jgi:hypothetical protein
MVAETYLKRADVYLKADNWHAAQIDFQRAESISPDFVDRWREISPLKNERIFVDLKTFNGERRDAINIWVKQVRGFSDDANPFSIRQFELNCSARQIRAMTISFYDAAGNVLGTGQDGNWESIVPESFGENLYNGACAHQ